MEQITSGGIAKLVYKIFKFCNKIRMTLSKPLQTPSSIKLLNLQLYG